MSKGMTWEDLGLVIDAMPAEARKGCVQVKLNAESSPKPISDIRMEEKTLRHGEIEPTIVFLVLSS